MQLTNSEQVDLTELKTSLSIVYSELAEIKALLKPVPVQKWVSKRQAMQITGASLRTLDNRLKIGLYTISKVGRRVMILRSDIEAHMARGIIKKRRQ
jgi:hypothetical protein